MCYWNAINLKKVYSVSRTSNKSFLNSYYVRNSKIDFSVESEIFNKINLLIRNGFNIQKIHLNKICLTFDYSLSNNDLLFHIYIEIESKGIFIIYNYYKKGFRSAFK